MAKSSSPPEAALTVRSSAWLLIPASVIACLFGILPKVIGASADAGLLVALFLSVSLVVGAFIDEHALHSLFAPVTSRVFNWMAGAMVCFMLLRLADTPMHGGLVSMYSELCLAFLGIAYLDFHFVVAVRDGPHSNSLGSRSWLCLAAVVGPVLVYALLVALVASNVGGSVVSHVITPEIIVLMSLPFLHLAALVPRAFPSTRGEPAVRRNMQISNMMSTPHGVYLALLGTSCARAPHSLAAVCLSVIPGHMLSALRGPHFTWFLIAIVLLVAAVRFFLSRAGEVSEHKADKAAGSRPLSTRRLAIVGGVLGLVCGVFNRGNTTQHLEKLFVAMGGSPESENPEAFMDKYAGVSGNDQHGANDAAIANSFYNLATEFYEYGWGDSFHFGFRQKHQGHNHAIDNSQALIGTKLQVKDMDRVLDMGCGIGGPLRGVVRRTGANITGVTINAFQIKRAREITSTLSPWMQKRCHFHRTDYLNVEGLETNAYDAAFYMESSLHCENRTKTFAETFKLLKPGGRLVALEYVTLDGWDSKDPELAELMRMHLRGNGAARTPTAAEAVQMVRDAGFDVEEHFDYMALGQEMYGDSEWPWWQDLQFNYRLHLPPAHPWIRGPLPILLHGLAALGLIPADVPKTAELMNEGGDGLSGLGMRGAITPQYVIVGVKPRA